MATVRFWGIALLASATLLLDGCSKSTHAGKTLATVNANAASTSATAAASSSQTAAASTSAAAPTSVSATPAASSSAVTAKAGGNACGLLSLAQASALTGLALTSAAESATHASAPFVARIGCHYNTGTLISVAIDVSTVEPGIPVQALATQEVSKLPGATPITIDGAPGIDAVIAGANSEETAFYKGSKIILIVIGRGKAGSGIAIAKVLSPEV